MDLMQKAGKYPPPQGATDILGPEAAGVVVSGSTFPYGTPVACLLPGGGYAEYVAASPELCFPIPSNLTVEEAACIPENWITAYQLLQEVGGLTDFPANGGKPSGVKSILVYAAASGVGVALLQIIRAFLPGAKVLAVAGTPEKLQCAENLGAAVSLNYKLLGDTLGDEALKRTDGQGVDLVLDCVGASLWEQTVKALRVDGTWILYGSLGGHRLSFSLASLLQKRLRLLSTTLRSRSESYQKELVANFKQDILPKLADGTLKVVVDRTFGAEEAEEAHQRLQESANIGKVVIILDRAIASLHGTP
ncbi:quinone oxidoreductase PIG3 [Cyclospora cayetanensis]|uniref:Quinone oxidoreductase PIG3 n=1 Tax=Cyclospora cayetanensis TaxID=88456 RepID=A0A6P6RYA9_9EIME|nr:quinone oxidoreductase PIG3 [Cyclospora cayetanensis]